MLGKAHKAAIEGIEKSIVPIEEMIEQVITQEQKAVYANCKLIKSVPGIPHLRAIYTIVLHQQFCC